MGRPSKLSPEQWETIGKRLAAGETRTKLAREYGVDESAIRRRISPITPAVRNVAEKLAEAQNELAALPVAHQYTALSLADDLRAVSTHLAGAAKYGSATAHRLAGIAHNKVAEIDNAAPLDSDSREALRDVAALTKLANEAASTGLNLLAANKDRIQRMDAAEREDANGDDDSRREALATKLEQEDRAPAG
jgi:hypothetical protein